MLCLELIFTGCENKEVLIIIGNYNTGLHQNKSYHNMNARGA